MSGAQWPATFTLSVRLRPQPGETGETSAESASASPPLQFQLPIHSGLSGPAGRQEQQGHPRQQQPVREALPFDPAQTLSPAPGANRNLLGFIVVLPWLQPQWESDEVVFVNRKFGLLGLQESQGSIYTKRDARRLPLEATGRCLIEEGLQEQEIAVYVASENATGNTVLQLEDMYQIKRMIVLAPGHNIIRRVLEHRGFVGREVEMRVNLTYVAIKLERASADMSSR